MTPRTAILVVSTVPGPGPVSVVTASKAATVRGERVDPGNLLRRRRRYDAGVIAAEAL